MAVIGGVAVSALLLSAYARGAWVLGFVALAPWLLALDRLHTVRGALVAALAMCVGLVAAAFAWFGPAVADYTGLHMGASTALLLALAPLLQPQLIAFAIARQLASRTHRHAVRAAVAIAAWLLAEWAVPRLFGDTLGQGLQPSRVLRQGADIAGVGGLTLVLLAVNEAIAAAIRRGRGSLRLSATPLVFAVVVPLSLAGYGMYRLGTLQAESTAKPLRVGLVQAAIVDYERLRREQGAFNVVRGVLDTHYALSADLRARGADAIIWPETVYPTTFGQPRTPAAAELDRELVAFVARIGVPLAFGTYTRDADGEYNAAAFVDPARGPLGSYRKTRLFPLTEYVPAAIDGPMLRRLLPWAGTWRPGDGARVFPLIIADGREIPVAPLICRDDVDAGVARDAARLGAQVLVGMSNDSWFTRAPLGARLHLAAASFRSVETRLPQVRATTNGLSAVVDATGEITASTAMGERTTLLAEIRPRPAAATLFMRWGAWLGPLSLLLLSGFAARSLVEARRGHGAAHPRADAALSDVLPVLLVSGWQRVAIGVLRALSRAAVLVLGVAALTGDGTPRVLDQLRDFATWVVAPELLAVVLMRACAASLRIERDRIVLESSRRRIEVDRAHIAAWRPWRLPWPWPGFDVVLQSGHRWTHGIGVRQAARVVRMLESGARRSGVEDVGPPNARAQAGEAMRAQSAEQSGDVAKDESAAVPATGKAPRDDGSAGPAAAHAQQSRTMHMLDALDITSWRIDHPLLKFVLFPLLPALPAFRLHQVIAYGSAFGEYYTFGAAAYLRALLLWWGSWAVALVLLAGGLRLAVETIAAATLAMRPRATARVRGISLGVARAVYFVGVPSWLAARLLLG